MNTAKKIRSAIILFILLCMAAYLGIAYYYMDGFSFGTWINGVYCTGKDVEEVNRELLEKDIQVKLQVIYPICGGKEQPEAERKSSHFVLDERTVQFDYTKPLSKLLQKQRPLFWAQNLFLPAGGYELTPAVILTENGEEEFEKQFLADEIVQAELEREARIQLESDEAEGFRLYDGKKNRFDEKKALQECMTAIKQGEESILLSAACYYDMEANTEEKEQEALYRELQEFLDFEIVYDMGAEQVRFDRKALVYLLKIREEREAGSVREENRGEETAAQEKENGKETAVAQEKEGNREKTADRKEEKSREKATGREVGNGALSFVRDAAGGFVWDEEKVTAAIDTLADRYDTYGKPRQFTTTDGDVITLEKGNYGTELNKKAEVKWLSEALAERKSETHVPDYVREAYARGENDIGETYIEINMTEQKLWFYQAGKVEIETPIVTGNMMRRRATPEGVYYVYAKQKNRILRGPGYASHVNYWMPVKGGVGIHDALWRDEFGGEIYKKDGSHGCINLPLEAAEKLYGMIEVGVPVGMYYEEEEP